MAEYDYLIDLNANTSGYYNDLRIPTYFENIDEIYDSIIQFKEQLVEKK